jgi:hypothetical protein
MLIAFEGIPLSRALASTQSRAVIRRLPKEMTSGYGLSRRMVRVEICRGDSPSELRVGLRHSASQFCTDLLPFQRSPVGRLTALLYGSKIAMLSIVASAYLLDSGHGRTATMILATRDDRCVLLVTAVFVIGRGPQCQATFSGTHP